MSVWSTQAANEIIRLALAAEKPLTHMQIQKLVYISHGWSLVASGQKLTFDDPEAWKFGPVFRLLWERLQYSGKTPISTLIPDDRVLPHRNAAPGKFGEQAKGIVQKVHARYGGFAGFQLSALTHREGSPWRQIYNDGNGQNQEIPAFMIRQHFIGLANRHRG